MKKPKYVEPVQVSTIDAELIEPVPQTLSIVPELLNELPERGVGKQLSTAIHLAILNLSAEGQTQMQIAAALSINQCTVSRVLAKYGTDARDLALMQRNARSNETMTKVLDSKDPHVLWKVLQGTKTKSGEHLIEPKDKPSGDSNSGRRAQVMVGVKVNLD